MEKIAVVLFNLGGPDKQEAVEPFLFNLFNDKAIISLPWPLRRFIAGAISRKRAPLAQEIYAHLGGSSPLLPQTEIQAKALQNLLDKDSDRQWKTFICMRYWHPMTEETVVQVKEYNPDTVILLPLYPQFSTTTSGSSLKAWKKESKKQHLYATTQSLCCYPTHPAFIEGHATLIQEALARHDPSDMPRLLFSAHGLPEKIIKKGDPYQWQVEQTVNAIIHKLEDRKIIPDWEICYQSRVGPLKWIGPSTDDAIKQAGKEKKPVMVIPIAFVSEHSETLVELDIEYKTLAKKHGIPTYSRVPTLGPSPHYIEALEDLCLQAAERTTPTCTSHTGQKICPKKWKKCPCS